MKILGFLGIKCKRQEPGSSSEQPELLSETLALHEFCPRVKLFVRTRSFYRVEEAGALGVHLPLIL